MLTNFVAPGRIKGRRVWNRIVGFFFQFERFLIVVRESEIPVVVVSRSSHSIVRYAFVYIMRLTGHTHDRESPIQNFSTAPKKLGAHISSPVWPPKPTEFVSYLGNLRCDAFTRSGKLPRSGEPPPIGGGSPDRGL